MCCWSNTCSGPDAVGWCSFSSTAPRIRVATIAFFVAATVVGMVANPHIQPWGRSPALIDAGFAIMSVIYPCHNWVVQRAGDATSATGAPNQTGREKAASKRGAPNRRPKPFGGLRSFPKRVAAVLTHRILFGPQGRRADRTPGRSRCGSKSGTVPRHHSHRQTPRVRQHRLQPV